MNKKYLVFPLISIALIGCSGIKAPDFEPYSKKVTADKFADAFEKSGFDDYLNFEKSTYGSSYTGYEIEHTEKVDNVVLLEVNGIEENNSTFKFDKENNISLSTRREKTDYSVSGATGIKNQSVSAYSINRQYQFHEFEEGNKLVSIDKDQKVYYLADSDRPEIIASEPTINMSKYELGLYSWTNYTGDVNSKFYFYVDNQVFTVIQETKITENDKDLGIKDEITSSLVYQYQIVNEDTILFRLSLENKAVTTYTKSGDNHAKGEVDTVSVKIYHTMEVHVANVSLQAIDLSTFAFRGADLDEAL